MRQEEEEMTEVPLDMNDYRYNKIIIYLLDIKINEQDARGAKQRGNENTKTVFNQIFTQFN